MYEGELKNDKVHGEGKMMEKGNIHLLMESCMMDTGGMTRGMEKEYLFRMLMESCMRGIGRMTTQIENLLQSVWCALRLTLQLAPL